MVVAVAVESVVDVRRRDLGQQDLPHALLTTDHPIAQQLDQGRTQGFAPALDLHLDQQTGLDTLTQEDDLELSNPRTDPLTIALQIDQQTDHMFVQATDLVTDQMI